MAITLIRAFQKCQVLIIIKKFQVSKREQESVKRQMHISFNGCQASVSWGVYRMCSKRLSVLPPVGSLKLGHVTLHKSTFHEHFSLSCTHTVSATVILKQKRVPRGQGLGLCSALGLANRKCPVTVQGMHDSKAYPGSQEGTRIPVNTDLAWVCQDQSK